MVDEAEERPRRRRRRRGRRGGSGGGVERRAPEKQTKQAAAPPEWNWRSFPVLFAFALGIVLMGLAVASPTLSFAVFIIGVMGVAFGLAHMATRAIVARRRQQR